MLLILHNLPKEVTTLDVRQLIQELCGFGEVILDNLLDEGPGKRITVGLAEEEDVAILMQKLNGLHYKQCQLFVEDVRKKKAIAPSYPILIPAGLQPQAPKPWSQFPVQKTTQVNNSNMPYYMTKDSSNRNYGKPTQTTTQDTSVFNRYNQYTPNDLYQAAKADNLWGHSLTSSNHNKSQGTEDPPSYQSYQNARDIQGDGRYNKTQPTCRENKSPPSKRHENIGKFSQRELRYGDTISERIKNSEGARRRDDDRSPPRGRNLFLEKKKDDRRDDFNSSRRSRASGSNPRDKDIYKNDRQWDREQKSLFGRQRECVFDKHEPRKDQKRNYEQVDRNSLENVQRREKLLTNVFQTPTIFSSKPGNTFTKRNRNIFDKIIGSHGFGDTSKHKVQSSSHKQDTSKSQVTFPAPKRARFDPPPQQFDNKKYENPNIPFKKATDFQKKMIRHTNWLSQSATLLAKEVLKNASSSKIPNTIFKTVLKKLRECIMSRLDVIRGDKIASNLDEILCSYRNKFNKCDDIPFFKAVMEKVERENADEVTGLYVAKEKQHQESEKFTKGLCVANPYYSPNANINKKKQPQENVPLNKGPSVINPYFVPRSELMMNPNFAVTGKQKGVILQNRPRIQFLKNPMTMPRLPKYPNSDKQGFKHFQKTALLEHEEGFYTMEPEFEKAVDEEVDKLVGCYIEACEQPTNKDEENIRNIIITSTADEFKKIIKLNVTKRILNVTDGLSLRIFSTPKPPPKAALDAFLKKHGAISLMTSDTTRMFVANCESYESYDRLLALQTTNFGNITIHIKPFHVLGPVTKKIKKANEPINPNAVEDFTKDVDELNIDLTNEMNDDLDVMLIENEQCEVVVIHDDLDKTIDTGNTSDNVHVINDKVREFNDLKALNTNVKVEYSIINFDDSNNIVAASNDKNVKVDDSNLFNFINEKVINFNKNVQSSDDKVDTCNVKIQDSRDKVQNSQTEEPINISKKNFSKSLDDILNEVDEILEDDLEDY